MSMSLTDKVIKNTFYLFLSQAVVFLTPFILTPVIISYIGNTQFGIYALVLGFMGTFGLFDLSISTSFIKFISEHYNRKEFPELNYVVNTGFYFYFLFSASVTLLGFVFSDVLISMLNIPADLYETAVFALRTSLIVFLFANSASIFISILISIQKMYLNSIIGIFINILNAGITYLLLYLGYGLKGILLSNLGAVIISVAVSIFLVLKEVPELKFSVSNWHPASFKKMTKFGVQMQVSKMSGFASEKYDEFLLGLFSVISNVTFYNLAGRITRLGRFVPLQLFQQVAPVAAELNAKENHEKLKELFEVSTRYLTFSAIPIFLFIFVFAELIISAWVGPGYEISAYLIRILAAGQLINLIISAPGNSIIPNLGYPKYLMYEGLINLILNLVLSFILIKHYGIIGAAIGNTVSIIVSSAYIYITSVRFFKENEFSYILKSYLKPLAAGTVMIIAVYFIYTTVTEYIASPAERVSAIIFLALCLTAYLPGYLFILFRIKYLGTADKNNLIKFFNHVSPFKIKLS
jgi:O-antigen/teichoic acid export membrane protein